MSKRSSFLVSKSHTALLALAQNVVRFKFQLGLFVTMAVSLACLFAIGGSGNRRRLPGNSKVPTKKKWEFFCKFCCNGTAIFNKTHTLKNKKLIVTLQGSTVYSNDEDDMKLDVTIEGQGTKSILADASNGGNEVDQLKIRRVDGKFQSISSSLGLGSRKALPLLLIQKETLLSLRSYSKFDITVIREPELAPEKSGLPTAP